MTENNEKSANDICSKCLRTRGYCECEEFGENNEICECEHLPRVDMMTKDGLKCLLCGRKFKPKNNHSPQLNARVGECEGLSCRKNSPEDTFEKQKEVVIERIKQIPDRLRLCIG